MSDTPKRFEEWEEVDCNECSHYWDSSCDGASKGSKIGCTSYLATRSIVVPEKLKKLERRVAWLELVTGVTIVLITIIFIVGCFIG